MQVVGGAMHTWSLLTHGPSSHTIGVCYDHSRLSGFSQDDTLVGARASQGHVQRLGVHQANTLVEYVERYHAGSVPSSRESDGGGDGSNGRDAAGLGTRYTGDSDIDRYC